MADDHPLYREGLVRSLAHHPRLEVVGEAADGREALEAIRLLEPAVALIDVKMPGLDGCQVLTAIRRDGLPTAVVLISAHGPPEMIYDCIALGAAAFLDKAANRDEICDAVAAAARGEVRLPEAVQGQLVDQIQLRAGHDAPRLTEREREALAMIAEGLSAPEIAARLTLSPATVKSHLKTLYDKLGVSDRAAAVARAMRIGLLE